MPGQDILEGTLGRQTADDHPDNPYSTNNPSVIGAMEITGAGNVLLRVGHLTRWPNDGWTQTEHLVLTPFERERLIERLVSARQPGDVLPGVTGMFAEILTTHHGDKVAAAVEVGRGLMRGDPAAFKAGYSRDSAALSVQRLYSLTDDQTDQVRERLPEDGDASAHYDGPARDRDDAPGDDPTEGITGATIGELATRAENLSGDTGLDIDDAVDQVCEGYPPVVRKAVREQLP